MRFIGVIKNIWISYCPRLCTFFVVVYSSVAFPQTQCLDLFWRQPRVDETGAYYTSRFDGFQKPLATPQFASPAQIVLSRFSGHNDFNSTTSQTWTYNGKIFVADGAMETWRIGFSPRESILADMQDFSLGKMVETEYLTPQQAEMFKKLGLSLHPSQVNFLEVVHRATPEEMARFYPTDPATRYGRDFIDPVKFPDQTSIKTAAMWSVAGQIVEQGKTKKLSLPWEKEDARQGQALDRTKYKFVWEWGRAAQDVPGEISPLYAANALLNYIELRAQGGQLEDAYVMVHSFDKVNTRLYSRMHPGTMYPKDWKDMNDVLFLIPLKEGLEKYRPSLVSEPIARIVEITQGKIKDIEALDLLIDARLLRWSELDFHTQRVEQSTPIIMNDMSVIRPHILFLWLKKFHLSPVERDAVIGYLIQQNPILHASNTQGQYNNAADSVVTSWTYQHKNAVEISNLDPKIAAFDPSYVASVLISAFSRSLDQVAGAIHREHQYPLPESYEEAAKAMETWELQWGITASSPEVERRLQQLNPIEVIVQPATQTEKGFDPYGEMAKLKPYFFREQKIYLFTFQQLKEMALQNPEFYRHMGSGLKPGIWQTRYLLSQPDIF